MLVALAVFFAEYYVDCAVRLRAYFLVCLKLASVDFFVVPLANYVAPCAD